MLILTARRSPRPLLGSFSYQMSASGVNYTDQLVHRAERAEMTGAVCGHTMLMMKNLGAMGASRVARFAMGRLTVAAPAWPTASRAAAAVEKKRMLMAGELLERGGKMLTAGPRRLDDYLGSSKGSDEGEGMWKVPSTSYTHTCAGTRSQICGANG